MSKTFIFIFIFIFINVTSYIYFIILYECIEDRGSDTCEPTTMHRSHQPFSQCNAVQCADVWSAIMTAPSLEEACKAAGILPKSAAEVKLLRSEKKRKREIKPTLYYGPYAFNPKWDSESKTLIVVGEPGVGKTQWARWYCAREGYFYCKNHLDCMRHYNGEAWIIFDDIHVEEYTNVDFQGVFDVERGGSIAARYAPIVFPENVKRIWLCIPANFKLIPDKKGNILPNNRKAVTIDYY